VIVNGSPTTFVSLLNPLKSAKFATPVTVNVEFTVVNAPISSVRPPAAVLPVVSMSTDPVVTVSAGIESRARACNV
jgi:hypothetical protein